MIALSKFRLHDMARTAVNMPGLPKSSRELNIITCQIPNVVLCHQRFAKRANHCQKELRYSVLKDMLVPDECQSVKMLL